MNKYKVLIAIILSLLLFCMLSNLVLARTVLIPDQLFEAEDESLDQTGGSYNIAGYLAFWGKGYIQLSFNISRSGYYKLLIRGYGQPASNIWPLLEAKDNLYNGYNWKVEADKNEPVVLVSMPTYFSPGTYDLGLDYLNDAYKPPEDRNLFLDWFLLVEVPFPDQDPDPEMLVKGLPLSSYGSLLQAEPARINLLTDPDFEKASDWGWYSYKAGGADGTYTVKIRDTEAAKFGNNSGSIELTDTGTVVKLVATPGHWLAPPEAGIDLVYSGWVKRAANTTATAQAEFLCYTDAAKTYVKAITKNINITSDDWQYFQFAFRAAEIPSNVKYIMPTLVARDGMGKIYFDGASLYAAFNAVPQEKMPLEVELVADKIKLTWETQDYNQLYEVHRGTTPDFILTDSSKLTTVTETNTWVDNNPDLQTLAYYKVKSINDYFAARDSIVVVNDLVPPNSLPESLQVSNQVGGILTVSWKPPVPAIDGERAAKYLIYRSKNSVDLGKGSPVITVYEDLTKQSFTWRDRDVVPGESYYYAIKCEDRVGNTNALSQPVGPIVPEPDELAPLQPVNVGISPAIKGALTLTWSRPGPAADDDLPEEYYILRSRESYGDLERALEAEPELMSRLKVGEVIANEETSFKFTDPDVVVGQTYYYHVLSVDKARNWRASGELVAKVLVPAVPTAQSPKLPDVVANQPITFSWLAPVLDYEDSVTSYTMEYSFSNSFSDVVSVSNITQTEHTLASAEQLAPGTFYWRVRAHYRSGVVGGFSVPLSFDVAEVDNSNFPVPYFNLLPRVVKTSEKIVATYVLDDDGWVTVKIFDSKGKLVDYLVSRQWQVAKDGSEYIIFQVEWDSYDQQGKYLTDGLYIGQLILEQPDLRPIVLYRRFQVYRAQ